MIDFQANIVYYTGSLDHPGTVHTCACMHAACMDNLWERQIFLYIDMTPFEKAKLLETFNTIYL